MKKLLLIIIFVLISNTIIAKNIELSFWFSGGFNANECIEEMVDEYNNLHMGVKVTAVFQGLYEQMETKLLAAALVGQLPDVVQEKFEYMDLYIEEGLILPIDDFITEYNSKDIFHLYLLAGEILNELRALDGSQDRKLDQILWGRSA